MKNTFFLLAITALEVVNKVNCAIAARKGTGSKHCSYKEGVPRAAWISRRGFDYATIADLTAEGIAKEIQLGNIDVLPNNYNFERLTEENQVQTSQIGLASLSRKGIYKYRFQWNRDDRLQEVMTSFDSNDIYDYAALDSKGNIKLTQNGNRLTGASVGLFDTQPFTEANGTDSGMVSAMIELNNPDDYNRHAAYIASENLNFRPLKVEGINEVNLTLTAFTAGTEVKFTAFLKDGTTAFQGGVAADFKLLKNGTAVTPTSVVEGEPGHYTITLAAGDATVAGDELKLSTWDDTTKTVAIIKDGVTVYRGATVTEVVA